MKCLNVCVAVKALSFVSLPRGDKALSWWTGSCQRVVFLRLRDAAGIDKEYTKELHHPPRGVRKHNEVLVGKAIEFFSYSSRPTVDDEASNPKNQSVGSKPIVRGMTKHGPRIDEIEEVLHMENPI